MRINKEKEEKMSHIDYTPNMRDKEQGWHCGQEWRKEGRDFLITIRHWHSNGPTYCNNVWNVYAVIGIDHPILNRVRDRLKRNIDLLPAEVKLLHWHEGITYCKQLFQLNEEGVPTIYAIRVGSDYNHLGDDRFRRAQDETYSTTQEIFADAQTLFYLLEEYSNRDN